MPGFEQAFLQGFDHKNVPAVLGIYPGFAKSVSALFSGPLGTRGETIHRNYGASRYSGHDSIHDSFSQSFDTVRFTQV